MKGGWGIVASKVFAAMNVGSNELSMKVYDNSQKRGEGIDYVNGAVELGSDTYNSQQDERGFRNEGGGSNSR